MTYEIAERAGHVEVWGASGRDITEALDLLDAVRGLQVEQVVANREQLVRALMMTRVSLTPPATLAQAQRLAAHRDALLSTPVFTYESLRLLRGDRQQSGTRTWVTRKRAQRALFTVLHNGATIVPAFQLREDGTVRDELRELLGLLIGAEVDGWQLWTWLTAPSSLLSGQVPERVARTQPERAANAAARFAQRSAA